MKKINSGSFLLIAALLGSTFAFSQAKSPISLQRRADAVIGKNQPNYAFPFNTTLQTSPGASLVPGLSDGADVRMFPSSNVQAEVTIVVNKQNPLNLLAAANTLTGPYAYNQGFYSSSDGGATFAGADKLQNINASYIYGDPSVAFSADNTAFMTSINANGGYWFQKSTDGGLTWGPGLRGDKGYSFDKEMCTSDDQVGSPYVNNFYCAWTDFNSGNGAVAFNRSTDKGTTFSNKIQLRSGTVGFGQGTNVQTGPNGEVYVCWAEHADANSPYAADGLGFSYSLDGGVTFTASASRKVFDYKGVRVDGYSSNFNYTRSNDFPAMAVDKSTGPNRGRIYVTYAAKLNDTGRSVINVRYSDDKGVTWTPLSKLVSITKSGQAWFPWITVDDVTGLVWVVYYAFDNQSNKYSTNTYVAVSANGGGKWNNLKVSDVPHITAAIDNVNFAYGYAGDYLGIAAYNGKAYPVWMDNRNGTWQVYCSTVTATRAFTQQQNTSDEAVASTGLNIQKLSAGPNPFIGSIRISLANAVIKTASLYNQDGTLIKQWTKAPNTLNVADVPRGTYIIKVTDTNNKMYSQKLIKQ